MIRQTPSQRLATLFGQADDAYLALNPIEALARGDARYAARVGDLVSPAYFETTRAQCRDSLAKLARIDRASLSRQDRLMCDVFAFTQRTWGRLADSDIETVSAVNKVSHFDSLISIMPEVASGGSITSFDTVEDYEAGLSRMVDFGRHLGLCQDTLVRGLAAGVTQPQIIVQQTSYLLGLILDQPLDQSSYLAPVRSFPPAIADRDRRRLEAAYRRTLETQLLPRYRRLKSYLDGDYIGRARSSVGVADVPNGRAFYDARIEYLTTTTMPADDIHRRGLELVEHYTQQMDAIRREVGFQGSLRAFFDDVRRDPKLKYPSREALLAAYRSVEAKVMPAIPQLFNRTPRTPFEIRLVPDVLEATQAGGYYLPGTPDGKRPGIFYVNAFDLASRTVDDRETLFLHEAIPGHHFQLSLVQENRALPAFQRFSGNNAYAEGWALYCETLGPELGLFDDPYQKLGHLDAMMLRAMRLVVDTGLHVYGWTRQRAIDYLMERSSIGATDARVEIDRYIAIPGQALGYMIGNLKIRELRERAAASLGSRFDVRAYHDIVLGSGPLPMTILDREVTAWASATA
jgi:uncharacterized protein (DUF885 family)